MGIVDVGITDGKTHRQQFEPLNIDLRTTMAQLDEISDAVFDAAFDRMNGTKPVKGYLPRIFHPLMKDPEDLGYLQKQDALAFRGGLVPAIHNYAMTLLLACHANKKKSSAELGPKDALCDVAALAKDQLASTVAQLFVRKDEAAQKMDPEARAKEINWIADGIIGTIESEVTKKIQPRRQAGPA